MAKHSSRILELARKGAEHRYEELRAELATLVRYFPHLAGRGRSRPSIDVSAEPAAITGLKPARRTHRKRRLSAAGRKKISEAQKKRWAALKAAAKKQASRRKL